MGMIRALGALLFLPVLAEAAESGEDKVFGAMIEAVMAPITEVLAGFVFAKIPLFGVEIPWVVLLLVLTGISATVYFRGIGIRGIPVAFRLVRGDYDDPNDPGEVTHFQALTTALSGTVGIGNIGGVAAAISIGGAGATFWMIVAGILGMATKFLECTLGVMYRQEFGDGHVSGGPMYYIRAAFIERNWTPAGKVMGAFYAVGIFVGCLGIGNMFQSNQAYNQFVVVTGGDASFFADKAWLFGILLAVLVGSVIVGGIQSIAAVTEKLVPFMALFYVAIAAVTLVLNADALAWTIATIVREAFAPEAVTGGMAGTLIVGFQRAVFSNEAGLGSASIAHSAVRTHEPITEGLVAGMGPLIDTVVICAMTALVVVSTGYYEPGFYENVGGTLQGITTTSAAFERNFVWAPYFIAIAAFMFAFSTIIAWSYYGLKGWTYIFGESKFAELWFKVVYCGFVAVGCVVQLGAVLDFSDATVFLICVPNIIGMALLAPKAKKALDSYFERLESGEIKNFRNAK
jgi:AGCS family alanine or glycine:cation symporter